MRYIISPKNNMALFRPIHFQPSSLVKTNYVFEQKKLSIFGSIDHL